MPAETPGPDATSKKVARFRPGSDVAQIIEVDASEFEKWLPGSEWPDSPTLQDRWATFVKDQAARIEACAGYMTDDTSPIGDTALEKAIWPRKNVWPYRRREVLSGYSWVTILPPELAERLGGAPTLTMGGAFSEVSDLPDGSVWLRATPTINEFTGDQICAVFQALAPILLTGRTDFRFVPKDNPARLVDGVDAADYQRRPTE
jgi:hypothetical protein